MNRQLETQINSIRDTMDAVVAAQEGDVIRHLLQTAVYEITVCTRILDKLDEAKEVVEQPDNAG